MLTVSYIFAFLLATKFSIQDSMHWLIYIYMLSQLLDGFMTSFFLLVVLLCFVLLCFALFCFDLHGHGLFMVIVA